MKKHFTREKRYTVLKNTDIKAGLNKTERHILETLCNKLYRYRVNAGKIDLDCVVVESDWPEYEPMWQAIEDRVMSEKSISQS